MGGRKKRDETKKIENIFSRRVTLSKRRKDLHSKAKELSSLTDSDIAVIDLSPTGQIHTNKDPSVVDAIVDRYVTTVHENNDDSGVIDTWKFLSGIENVEEYSTPEERMSLKKVVEEAIEKATTRLRAMEIGE